MTLQDVGVTLQILFPLSQFKDLGLEFKPIVAPLCVASMLIQSQGHLSADGQDDESCPVGRPPAPPVTWFHLRPDSGWRAPFNFFFRGIY